MPWFRARDYTLYQGDALGETAGEAVASPSSLAVVIVRVEVEDKSNAKDVAAAQDIFNGISIKGNQSAEFPALDLLSGFDEAVAAEGSRRMDEALAAVSFTDTVVGPGQEPGVDVPILNHSAGTTGGWGEPDPPHSAYEIILLDKNGESMVGGNGTYAVTTKEPPVYAFEQNDATPDDIEKLREELRAYTESHRDSQYAKDLKSSRFYKAMEKEGDIPVYVASATVYFDDPGKGLGKTREEVAFMNTLLRPYFDNLDHELVIITPYFVPGDGGVQKVLDVVKRGISVVVITNSYGLTDNVAVHAGYSRYREALLAGGMKIYELKVSAKKPRQKDSVAYSSGASLHAKSFIFDEKSVFIDEKRIPIPLMSTLQSPGISWSKLVAPPPNGFTAHGNTTIG